MDREGMQMQILYIHGKAVLLRKLSTIRNCFLLMKSLAWITRPSPPGKRERKSGMP